MPANGKFNPWQEWCWSTMEQDGQTVRGYLYRNKDIKQDENLDELELPRTSPVPWDPDTEDPNVYVFTYFVSCVLPGEFVSESAYITPYEAGIAAKSERTTVTIQPYE